MLPELVIENLSREELLKEAKRRKFNPTKAEKLLWQRLRRKRMLSLNFTRQHVCKNFIFDFYCHKLKLIIEVDYSVNNLLKDYYYERDLKLTKLGYRILRFKNDLIIEDYSNSISRIYKMVNYLVGLN
ncbi:MAG: endonuclease domain-containing protein [Brevefilum sp.]|nr:endonuclease domain-containing protein [Brevefilum sp.]